MIITPSKLLKEFTLPLFIDNSYTGDLYKKCSDRYGFTVFYEAINSKIFKLKIKS